MAKFGQLAIAINTANIGKDFPFSFNCGGTLAVDARELIDAVPPAEKPITPTSYRDCNKWMRTLAIVSKLFFRQEVVTAETNARAVVSLLLVLVPCIERVQNSQGIGPEIFRTPRVLNNLNLFFKKKGCKERITISEDSRQCQSLV